MRETQPIATNQERALIETVGVGKGVTRSPDMSQGEMRRWMLRWTWRMLWRGKHLVLACWLLALAPTILFLQQTPRRYTASARIMIEAPEAKNALEERAASRTWLTESMVQTEADLISSTVLVRRAIEKLHLLDDPEFNAALREPRPFAVVASWINPWHWIPDAWTGGGGEVVATSATDRDEMTIAAVTSALLVNLSVRVQRRSFVILLQFSSEKRKKAALIANTLAELYVVDRLEANFEEARRVSNWLGDRLETLRREVVASETAVETYRAAHSLRRKGEMQATLSDQQLSELNSRLVIARAEYAQKQARLEQVRGLVRSQGNADSTTDVLQSQLIQRLREQEAIKQREMSEALNIYGDRHPRILGYRADLASLRSKIAHEIEKIGASIANEVEVAMTGVRTLERELNSMGIQSNAAGGAAIRLHDLERQTEASRTLYEAYLSRFKREAEQSRVQRANARIISPADIPFSSSYPATGMLLSLVSLLSLVAGIGLITLLDRLDNAIRSAEEAEALTDVPMLANVPLNTGGSERPIEDILSRPRSTLADSVRSLRTALDLDLDLGEERNTGGIVLVTSSVPKEGKSFVSQCLAVSFAQAGRRVLLIDGDVHRPSLHRAIGVEGERGLAQIMIGEATPEEVIVRGIYGTLDFLPAGRHGQLAELIKKREVETIILALAKEYDQIVIDTPPVLAVTDTRVMAQIADRVIYLIKWNSTPRDAVRNGIRLLRGTGVNVFGLVLSQVNQRKHDRYGYGDYGYYYGRYRDYYGE